MNDQNNSHGNGNGHRAPFRLAPFESPEEEARTDLLKEIAPKVRRKVREDSRLSPGAKFFFYALFDDCFWRQVGGHGTGQLYADVRTLADRYGHDEGSILRWRDELVDAGWLWTSYQWPMTEWRITPLLPAPVAAPHKRAVQMALGRAANPVGEMHTGQPGNGKTGNSGKTPGADGQKAPSSSAKRRTLVRIPPGDRVQDAPNSVCKIHTSEPQDAHGLCAKCTRASRKMHTGAPQDAHGRAASRQPSGENSSRQPAQSDGRERLLGEGSLGGKDGESPPAATQAMRIAMADAELGPWAKSLVGSFPSRLERTRTKLRGQLSQAAKNQRPLLKRKIAVLDELIDGPAPPPPEAESPAPPAVRGSAAERAASQRALSTLRAAIPA